ncbi:SET and MYND domaincontaining protein 4like, partial [Caligus rogercresseyi]
AGDSSQVRSHARGPPRAEGNLLSLNYSSEEDERMNALPTSREASEDALVKDLLKSPKCSKDYPFMSKRSTSNTPKRKGGILSQKNGYSL